MSPRLSPPPPAPPKPGVNPNSSDSMAQGSVSFLECFEVIDTFCPYLTYNWK